MSNTVEEARESDAPLTAAVRQRDVAKVGYQAMQRGEGDVVSGFKNKIQAAMAAVTPQSILAEQHRKIAEPGTAKEQ